MTEELIEAYCEQLQSSNAQQKRIALQNLQKMCEDSEVSTDTLAKLYDELYLHILKAYSDRYESVRTQALDTVMEFSKRLPKDDFHCLNIIATLRDRMGKEETVESCEELRLACMQQLHSLVEQHESKSLQENYGSIVPILMKGVRDTFSHVQQESCACIVTLAAKAEAFVFQPYAEQLAKPLYSVLNHKHSPVRRAAISALARLALHINCEGLPRLIMEVSPLLMDSMPLVRQECGDMGVLLLLELKDRYSYFDRIIPLVLCCLKDESPEVSNYIRQKWIKCGQLYYEENEAELNKQGLADVLPTNYPNNVKRPTLGCRALVQRSLRLLQLITRESGDWKDNVRLHSLKLLYQFVLHAEAAMTAKFFEIYPDLARACRDSDTAVAQEACKVADLMGRLMIYDDWCEHGFDGLAKNAREGYLKCFFFMFAPSVGVGYKDICKLARILATPEFSQTLKPEFQSYVIKMIEVTLEKLRALDKNDDGETDLVDLIKRLRIKASEENEECQDPDKLFENLYVATIKVLALSKNIETSSKDENLEKKAQNIFDLIAQCRQCGITKLHEDFFIHALDYVDNLDAYLDGQTEPILLLDGLITIGRLRPAYMKKLQEKIMVVFKNCADDAKIRIFSVISIIFLDWEDSIGKENLQASESIDLLEDFVKEIIEPHLLWRAGANAEAMRSLATATLCSISQGAPNEAHTILIKYAKYFPGLLEDHAVATRNYALKCLFNFRELEMEHLKPIAYAALQRLDDPSADVRELAVKVLPKFQPKFTEDFTREVWDTFIRKAFDMLLLHFEGPELRLKNPIKNSIKLLSAKFPELYKASFQNAMAASSANSILKELENEDH